jgi:hypothetical protein
LGEPDLYSESWKLHNKIIHNAVAELEGSVPLIAKSTIIQSPEPVLYSIVKTYAPQIHISLQSIFVDPLSGLIQIGFPTKIVYAFQVCST